MRGPSGDHIAYDNKDSMEGDEPPSKMMKIVSMTKFMKNIKYFRY